MGLLDEARAKNRESSRTRGEQRGPRNAQEAKPKDTYYRPEYGWIMSDKQVKDEKGVKSKYDENSSSVRKQIASADQSAQGSINDGVNQISGQYDSAIGGMKQPDLQLYPVRVVHNGQIEGTYYLPKSTIDTMDTDSFNFGKGSYTGNWVDNGANYNVDVNSRGMGDRGQELHDSLRGASDQVAKAQQDGKNAYNQAVSNANSEKDAAISGFQGSSNSSLAKQREIWNKEQAHADAMYGNRIATGKQQYETSKKNYNDSLMNMDAGLLESPTSQVVTGGVAQGATDQVLKEVK